MKKIYALAAALITAAAACAPAQAIDLKDLMKGGSGTDALSNLVDGVLSRSDLEVKDIAGTWTSTGSAVSFKSDNLLKKAGGVAAAAAVESKINPYFKQYGLNGSVFTVNNDGTFTLKISKLPLSGTIEKSGKGEFLLKFQASKLITLGKMTVYVTKSSSSIDLMMDGTRLKQIMSVAANLSGATMVKAASSILDSYDGLLVGFKMKKTAPAK